MQKKRVEINLMLLILIIVVILAGGVILIKNIGKNKNSDDVAQNDANNPNAMQNNVTETKEDFALKFLKLENNKENMVYSPLSIKYALKMLSDGTAGDTKTQIDNLIGELTLPEYENVENTIAIANAIFIRDTYYRYVKDEYKDILSETYNADIEQDSFKNAENINDWIADKTFDQIKNMVSDDDASNPASQVFLINALAIDIEWASDFDPADTYGQEFHLSNGETMEATMMHKKAADDNVSYCNNDKVTALSMDLEETNGTQLQFMAIMPNSDLQKYVANFTVTELKDIEKNMNTASSAENGIDVTMPRFAFDYNLNLKEDLKVLGINNIFNAGSADLSNMSSLKGLYVSNVAHKANMELSEAGVKAVAATVVQIAESATMQDVVEPTKITIDKPFLCVIKDKETDEIWFVGTVYRPNTWEDDKADYEAD